GSNPWRSKIIVAVALRTTQTAAIKQMQKALTTRKRLQRLVRLAISNRSIQSDSSTIATNTFFISQHWAAWNLIASRLACRIRTRATSRAGVILGETICVAAGTLGLCLTKQFKAAKKNGRIRRHSRFNSPNGASNCTERRASEPCWIPFSASVIPRSQRSAVALKDFSDLKSTKLIWRKRNGELTAIPDRTSSLRVTSAASTGRYRRPPAR